MQNLAPKSLSDLNQAFSDSPEGFLVVDQGVPRFAVLDYQTYKKLRSEIGKAPITGKILVTGGAGYIGSATVRLLRDKGFDVVVYDNLSTGVRERVGDCPLVVGDLSDLELLNKTFDEGSFDAVVHFAGSVVVEESVKNPAKYFQNNVVNGLNLLRAMVDHGVQKIVFSSSAAVYGEPIGGVISEDMPCDPTNPYGESKLMFERILRDYAEAYGLRATALRYFNASGSWPEAGVGYRYNGEETHLVPRLLQVAAGTLPELVVNGQNYDTPDRTCVRDYIHIRDLAEAHVLALKRLSTERGFAAYNVGTGKGYSVLEVIEAAMDITGRMVPMRFAERRAGDPPKLVADTSKMKLRWNWQPKHDLNSILESSWQWLQQNKKAT